MTDWKVPETSPRASPDQIRHFLDAYGSLEFRHCGELVPIMERDDPDESRIAAHDARLDDGLRSIYRVRAAITASHAPVPDYPPSLADDVRDLVAQLDTAKDQPLRFWSIDLPSGIVYIVFELLDDRRVAGCVKSTNQRVVDPTPR